MHKFLWVRTLRPSQILIDLAPQPVSFNTIKTPPRRATELPSIKSTLLFDNFDKLLELLRWEIFHLAFQQQPADLLYYSPELTARILGFLMLILPKAHVLDMSRKLSQRQNGITSDGRMIC